MFYLLSTSLGYFVKIDLIRQFLFIRIYENLTILLHYNLKYVLEYSKYTYFSSADDSRQ